MPNVHHSTLCLGELLGHPVERRRVPIIAGGRMIKSSDGQQTMFIDEPPEAVAMRRWSAGDFHGVERDFAKGWRAALKQLDLDALAAAIRPPGKSPLRNLRDVKDAADRMAEGRGKRYALLKFAMDVLGIPAVHRCAIISRWKACGGPPLSQFAPYAHHVVTVDIFFLPRSRVSSDTIRPSISPHRHRLPLLSAVL
jgi:hypothetical protein